MSALDTIRFIAASIPALFWLVVCLFNSWIGVGYVLNRRTPSPAVIIGSVAGLLAVVAQPISVQGKWIAVLLIAFLPDIVWIAGSMIACLLDKVQVKRNR